VCAANCLQTVAVNKHHPDFEGDRLPSPRLSAAPSHVPAHQLPAGTIGDEFAGTTLARSMGGVNVHFVCPACRDLAEEIRFRSGSW
jgi:hypothetical protein